MLALNYLSHQVPIHPNAVTSSDELAIAEPVHRV